MLPHLTLRSFSSATCGAKNRNRFAMKNKMVSRVPQGIILTCFITQGIKIERTLSARRACIFFLCQACPVKCGAYLTGVERGKRYCLRLSALALLNSLGSDLNIYTLVLI
jgi:hypothetical protein